MSMLTEYKAHRVEAFPSEVVECRLCGEIILLHPLEVVFHLAVHGLPLERLFGFKTNVDWRNVECAACFDSRRLKKCVSLDMVGLLRHLKQCPMRNKLFSRGAYPLCLFEHAITLGGGLSSQTKNPVPRIAEKNELANIFHSIPHVPGWCTTRENDKRMTESNDVWSEHSYARCECAAELKLCLCEFPRVVFEEDPSLNALSIEQHRNDASRALTKAEDIFVKLETVYDECILKDEAMFSEEMDLAVRASSVRSEPADKPAVLSYDSTSSSPEQLPERFVPLRFIAEIMDYQNEHLGVDV